MVAGEPSGDQLAAYLISALKARRPELRFSGIGGPKMIAQGFESHVPMEKLAVRGYAEGLRHYREIMGIPRRLPTPPLGQRPSGFIGGGFSGFKPHLGRQPQDAR